MTSLPHWPDHLPALPSGMLQRLDQSLPDLQADSLMLWILIESHDVLLSVYNPTHPDLCGFQQPLSRGVISQVFLTGLPILESNLKERPDHDPALDNSHQHTTRSMIAAPVAQPEGVLGILSAVQFSEVAHSEDFQLSHLQKLHRLASQIGQELTAAQE